MLDRRALVLVAVAIGIGAVGMALSWLLSLDTHMEPATYLRYAIVVTVGIYAVVGLLVVTQITPSVKLRWREGSPAPGIGLGLLVGGGLSVVALLLVSAASGHLSSDPRVVALMSEGDVSHIAITLALTCLAAPLVEEVLFRGLLLESLRARGNAAAIWISAAAFAVWHLNPSALRYYALMGALLGWLYVKRGLVCSMAAHFAFNGVLGIAALAVVLSPGSSVALTGATLHLPRGWHQSPLSAGAMLDPGEDRVSLRGPSGSFLVIRDFPSLGDTPVTADDLVSDCPMPAGDWQLDGTTLHETVIGGQTAGQEDFTWDQHRGTLTCVSHAGRSYEFVFLSAGSTRATADLSRILGSLQLS